MQLLVLVTSLLPELSFLEERISLGCKLRLVSRKIKKKVDLWPEFLSFKRKREEMRELLWFDRGVYDELYYPRLLLERKLTPELEERYRKLTHPQLKEEYCDLEEGFIPVVVEALLPLELRLFFLEFFQNPNPLLELPTPEYVEKYSGLQASILRQYLIHDSPELTRVVFFTPVCFGRKRNPCDPTEEERELLCFTNAVAEELSSELPPLEERFLVFPAHSLPDSLQLLDSPETLLSSLSSLSQALQPLLEI